MKGKKAKMFYKTKTDFSVLGIYKTAGVIVVVWTVMIAGMLYWLIHNERSITMQLATSEALAHFNKDQAFRLWMSSHGGVYVLQMKELLPTPTLPIFLTVTLQPKVVKDLP